MTEKDLTIKELHTILTDLIEKGHGDKEFQLYYDSEVVYTTIPKGSPIRFIGDGVRFTDYESRMSDRLFILCFSFIFVSY